MIPQRSLAVAQPRPRVGLDTTTWESRKRMTAAELISLMGDGWIGHPQYKPRGRVKAPNVPLRNLAHTETIDIEAPRNFWRFLAWMLSAGRY